MKQIEQKISSREVAEMMEVQHKDLLKKIDSINEHFGGAKVRYQKYWSESTFINRGKEYREFQITKRGCEFLAHKSTGEKGNLFTDRYMDKFEEMRAHVNENPKPKQLENDEAKLINARARLMNAQFRTLKPVLDNPTIPASYKEIINSKLVELATGEQLLPLPKIGRKTYSATEIGKQLGISSNKVGTITNKHNLKTDEYGTWVFDKSRHSNKQVTSFVYYDNAIEEIKKYI